MLGSYILVWNILSFQRVFRLMHLRLFPAKQTPLSYGLGIWRYTAWIWNTCTIISRFFCSWCIRSSTFETYLEEEILQQAGKTFFHFAGLVLSDWGVRGTLTLWAACHVNEIEWGLVIEYISFVAPQKISWHIKSVTPVMYVFRRYDYETFLQACIQSWLFRWLVFKSAEIPCFFTDSTSWTNIFKNIETLKKIIAAVSL